MIASGSASFSLAVTPSTDNFPYPVSFTVSGLPKGYTAAFSPSTVTPESATVQSQLMIAPASPAVASLHNDSMPFGNSSTPFGIAATCLFFPLCFGRGARRRLRFGISSALALFSLFATMGLTGCVATRVAPAPTTFNITITATGNGQQHSANLTLTIKP